MTDHDLSELLDRLGERTDVGAAPVAAMLADADRQRRRRASIRVTLAAAAVVAVVGGTALTVATLDDDGGNGEPAPGTTGPTVEPVPDGKRLVGIGHAAIAVPEAWGTNVWRCGTPTADTVIIDISVIEACGLFGAKVFDSVWIQQGPNWNMFEPDTTIEMDGVPAQLQRSECPPPASDGYQPACSGTVYIPSEDAYFVVEAPTSGRVDEILSWIRIVPDLTAVPGYQSANARHQDEDAAEHYRADLVALGVEVRTVTEKRPGHKPGYVLDVSPQPGTMVEPGTLVTVTEIAEPEGPADEVNISLNSVGPGDSMDYRGRNDAQIRGGAELRLDLGGNVWIHGFGKHIGSLAGEIEGSALVLDDWKEGPNYGRNWRAVERGTSTITVTITVDGERIVIGTVTVIVE